MTTVVLRHKPNLPPGTLWQVLATADAQLSSGPLDVGVDSGAVIIRGQMPLVMDAVEEIHHRIVEHDPESITTVTISSP